MEGRAFSGNMPMASYNTPPLTMGGIPQLSHNLSGNQALFSCREGRYTPALPVLNTDHFSFKALGSSDEALAFWFASQLQEELPSACRTVKFGSKLDISKYFDQVDVGNMGAGFLTSVLEKISWQNSNYEERVKTFGNDWTHIHEDRYMNFMKNDYISWTGDEISRYGAVFLRDVLKYLLGMKNLWLRSHSNTPTKPNTEPAPAAQTSSQDEPTICQNEEACPLFEAATTATPKSRRGSSCPPNPTVTGQEQQLLDEFQVAACSQPRKEHSSPGPHHSTLSSTLPQATKKDNSAKSEQPTDWATLSEYVEAPLDNKDNEESASTTSASRLYPQQSTNAETPEKTMTTATDEYAPKSDQSHKSHPDTLDGSESQRVGSTETMQEQSQAERRKSFDEMAQEFIAQSKEVKDDTEAPSNATDSKRGKENFCRPRGPSLTGGFISGPVQEAESRTYSRSSHDSLSTILNEDPSIMAASIGGEQLTGPDHSPKHPKSKSSSASLNSLIGQDPGIVAASLDGQSRVSPDAGAKSNGEHDHPVMAAPVVEGPSIQAQNAPAMPPQIPGTQAIPVHLPGTQNFPVNAPITQGGPIYAPGANSNLPFQPFQPIGNPHLPGFASPHGSPRNTFRQSPRLAKRGVSNNVPFAASPLSNIQPMANMMQTAMVPPVGGNISYPPMPNFALPPVPGANPLAPSFHPGMPFQPSMTISPDGKTVFSIPGNAFAPPNPAAHQSSPGRKHPPKLYTDDARMISGIENFQSGTQPRGSPAYPKPPYFGQFQIPSQRDASGNSAYWSATSRNSSNQSAGSTMMPTSFGSQQGQYAGYAAVNPGQLGPLTPQGVIGPSGQEQVGRETIFPAANNNMVVQPNSQTTAIYIPEAHETPVVSIPSPAQQITIPKRHHRQQDTLKESSGHGPRSYGPKRFNTEIPYRRSRFNDEERQVDMKKLHICGFALNEQTVSLLCNPFGPTTTGPIIRAQKTFPSKGPAWPYCFVEFDDAEKCDNARKSLDGRVLENSAQAIKVNFAFIHTHPTEEHNKSMALEKLRAAQPVLDQRVSDWVKEEKEQPSSHSCILKKEDAQEELAVQQDIEKEAESQKGSLRGLLTKNRKGSPNKKSKGRYKQAGDQDTQEAQLQASNSTPSSDKQPTTASAQAPRAKETASEKIVSTFPVSKKSATSKTESSEISTNKQPDATATPQIQPETSKSKTESSNAFKKQPETAATPTARPRILEPDTAKKEPSKHVTKKQPEATISTTPHSNMEPAVAKRESSRSSTKKEEVAIIPLALSETPASIVAQAESSEVAGKLSKTTSIHSSQNKTPIKAQPHRRELSAPKIDPTNTSAGKQPVSTTTKTAKSVHLATVHVEVASARNDPVVAKSESSSTPKSRGPTKSPARDPSVEISIPRKKTISSPQESEEKLPQSNLQVAKNESTSPIISASRVPKTKADLPATSNPKHLSQTFQEHRRSSTPARDSRAKSTDSSNAQSKEVSSEGTHGTREIKKNYIDSTSVDHSGEGSDPQTLSSAKTLRDESAERTSLSSRRSSTIEADILKDEEASKVIKAEKMPTSPALETANEQDEALADAAPAAKSPESTLASKQLTIKIPETRVVSDPGTHRRKAKTPKPSPKIKQQPKGKAVAGGTTQTQAGGSKVDASASASAASKGEPRPASTENKIAAVLQVVDGDNESGMKSSESKITEFETEEAKVEEPKAEAKELANRHSEPENSGSQELGIQIPDDAPGETQEEEISIKATVEKRPEDVKQASGPKGWASSQTGAVQNSNPAPLAIGKKLMTVETGNETLTTSKHTTKSGTAQKDASQEDVLAGKALLRLSRPDHSSSETDGQVILTPKTESTIGSEDPTSAVEKEKRVDSKGKAVMTSAEHANESGHPAPNTLPVGGLQDKYKDDAHITQASQDAAPTSKSATQKSKKRSKKKKKTVLPSSGPTSESSPAQLAQWIESEEKAPARVEASKGENREVQGDIQTTQPKAAKSVEDLTRSRVEKGKDIPKAGTLKTEEEKVRAAAVHLAKHFEGLTSQQEQMKRPELEPSPQVGLLLQNYEGKSDSFQTPEEPKAMHRNPPKNAEPPSYAQVTETSAPRPEPLPPIQTSHPPLHEQVTWYDNQKGHGHSRPRNEFPANSVKALDPGPNVIDLTSSPASSSDQSSDVEIASDALGLGISLDKQPPRKHSKERPSQPQPQRDTSASGAGTGTSTSGTTTPTTPADADAKGAKPTTSGSSTPTRAPASASASTSPSGYQTPAEQLGLSPLELTNWPAAVSVSVRPKGSSQRSVRRRRSASPEEGGASPATATASPVSPGAAVAAIATADVGQGVAAGDGAEKGDAGMQTGALRTEGAVGVRAGMSFSDVLKGKGKEKEKEKEGANGGSDANAKAWALGSGEKRWL